ncbi:hypothetical protein BDN70DRAFT_873728 [Pholiota conissans]|uniref:G-patch domain-containing protein n=1 Tax=Pholiota conissans TaxID=109636 RepID=A0A9P5Z9K6_9AGAR|nr:hypothetical protein BDN70DRAFT_873728 [Pholiota conissans]
MPLDGHSYLVSQGWGGKGTGLREGAISRPIAISQKKNLAGLGKDRDEAFPFWDHLFSAAAKSIVVKCLSDDEDASESSSSNEVAITRTSTGILSNRRPLEGTPATSGSSTPNTSSTNSSLSLIAIAKRDAARRGLYSRFFKGPVLGPESIAEEERRLAALVSETFEKQGVRADTTVKVTEHIEIQMATERVSVDLEVSKSSHKKRKTKVIENLESEGESESEAARRERKRRRREEKKARKEEKEKEKDAKPDKKKSKKCNSDRKAKHTPDEAGPSRSSNLGEESDDKKETKSERKRRKEEKQSLKALHMGDEDAIITLIDDSQEDKPFRSKSESKATEKDRRLAKKLSKEKSGDTTTALHTDEATKKKKRKRTHDED